MARGFRKTYRGLSLFLLCVLIIGMLGACGGDGQGSVSESEATAMPEVDGGASGGEGATGQEGVPDGENASASPEGGDVGDDGKTVVGATETVVGTTEPKPSEVPGVTHTNLKDAYANHFSVGVAINAWQLEDKKTMKVVKKHFNSVTMENAMKPTSLLDMEASGKAKDGEPKIRTQSLAYVLDLVQSHGLKLRGHTLVWHNQTPEWFFREGYVWEGDLVSKEVMLQRMESYIKQVMEYCQDNYPGLVYAWDVVNEGMADDGGYREEDSLWYQTVGSEEYIEKAFEYARKYAADGVKLFYNDYNEYATIKREYICELLRGLKDKGLVDGMGMQMHIDMSYPSISDVEDAIRAYSEIGLEIQLTEIDMHNPSDKDEDFLKQAVRYQLLFQMLLREMDGGTNITNVTFWGLSDVDTWLSNHKGEQSYPLLFDAKNKPKLAVEYLLQVINGDE